MRRETSVVDSLRRKGQQLFKWASGRRVSCALLGVVGLAWGLRTWGIGFGLPYDLTADEPHHIVQALRLGAGERGPLLQIWHTVGKGGLDYLLFVEYGILYVVWTVTGRVTEPRDFALRYLQDPSMFYLIGRLTVAIMGTLTCLVAFWVGRRMYDVRVGLGAAFLGATAYFHGMLSHTINVHVAATLGLWASVFAYLQYEKSERARWIVVSGVLCGLAITLAYTAAIGIVLLVLAIGWSPSRRRVLPMVLKQAGLLVGATVLTVAVVAPDLLSNIRLLTRNFSQILGSPAARPEAESIRKAIDSVTILREQEWSGYVQILFKDYNLLLAASALFGAAIGLARRERWSVLLSVASGSLLFILSASDRGAGESYLLPVTPALWLLSSQAVHFVGRGRWWIRALGLGSVAALPFFLLVQHDFLCTRPDTRVLAKQWVEANAPAGAKILMDGMRFRFIQSPPLSPNPSTVARRLAGLNSGELSISPRLLSLYAEAMQQVRGPTYELHSTVYGLEVEDLDYYVRACFNYIIVSSYNEKRYASELNSTRFPKSARFYQQLKRDPRFRRVYSAAPTPWKNPGPAITVYALSPGCASQEGPPSSEVNGRKPPGAQR